MTSSSHLPRRSFITTSLALGAVAAAAPLTRAAAASGAESFKISLAQWSLNKRFLKRAGAEPLDNLEFARIARSLGIDGIEYVNQMFKDKATDRAYLGEMKARAASEGSRACSSWSTARAPSARRTKRRGPRRWRIT
jgi:L-ribulose-5-phosphate 3-epimerase